jgi:hypothetical protein
MDPADDAARAQKRRRLNDDYCLEPQHAEVSSTNNALYDQNGCGSTSIYELSGPSNPTDTRAERAAVRTTLDDASLECCYGMVRLRLNISTSSRVTFSNFFN